MQRQIPPVVLTELWILEMDRYLIDHTETVLLLSWRRNRSLDQFKKISDFSLALLKFRFVLLSWTYQILKNRQGRLKNTSGDYQLEEKLFCYDQINFLGVHMSWNLNSESRWAETWMLDRKNWFFNIPYQNTGCLGSFIILELSVF